MNLYIDSSAFAKRHLELEHDHRECLEIMDAATEWRTSRLTTVEAPRAVSASGASGRIARDVMPDLDADLADTFILEVDRITLDDARSIATRSHTRSMDAVHIASALRFDDPDMRFLTYDNAQARAAVAHGLRLAR